MTHPEGFMADFDRRLELLAWRGTKAERAFVERLRGCETLTEEEERAAALFHTATYLFLRQAEGLYQEIIESDIPVVTFSLTDPAIQSLQFKLWGFLHSAKSVLDSLAREINLVYWRVDPLRQLFDPFAKPRWITFYTVRERLLLLDAFRGDPLCHLLRERTRSEAADQVYRDLSHLANASLICLPMIGRIEPKTSPTETAVKVHEARVLIPDDPSCWPYTYVRGFEVNRLFQEILHWLEELADEVYDNLEAKVRSKP